MSTAVTHTPPAVRGDGSWAEWVAWANQLPNFAELGLRCLEVGPGMAIATLDGSRFSPNPNGAINGGLVLSAADQCMGVVALTEMSAGELPVTATFNAGFLRPAMPPLTFRAAVAQAGKSLVFVTVDVEDARGRPTVCCSGAMAAQSSERHLRA